MHELLRHEFAFEFDIPATYPATAPEIRIPELDGKTAKMFRGGAICLTVHFKPLWAKNRCARLLTYRLHVNLAFISKVSRSLSIRQCYPLALLKGPSLKSLVGGRARWCPCLLYKALGRQVVLAE